MVFSIRNSIRILINEEFVFFTFQDQIKIPKLFDKQFSFDETDECAMKTNRMKQKMFLSNNTGIDICSFIVFFKQCSENGIFFSFPSTSFF